jgi:uncharacterized phage infection (PIP) family protein YhgE
MDEDYDMVPHNEIIRLKKEMEALKSGSGNIQKPMEELSNNLNKMISIFNTAVDELKLEKQEEEFTAKKLDPINEKLDNIIEQNKQIAEAIVAVVDMVKEKPKPIEPKPEA